MVQCEECDLWRLLYSKRKLSAWEKTQLQSFIDNIAYLCGVTMHDLDLPDKFSCSLCGTAVKHSTLSESNTSTFISLLAKSHLEKAEILMEEENPRVLTDFGKKISELAFLPNKLELIKQS